MARSPPSVYDELLWEAREPRHLNTLPAEAGLERANGVQDIRKKEKKTGKRKEGGFRERPALGRHSPVRVRAYT